MYFHKPQEKPRRWGSFQDVQYAIRKNSEKIYGIDPDNDVLVMPLFWGLPPLDYSGKNNHGTNYGATYKDGSLDFDGSDDYIDIPSFILGTAFTYNVWLYWPTVSASRTIIDNDDDNRWFGMISESRLVFYDGAIMALGSISSGWNMVTVTYDSGVGSDNLRGYANGVELETKYTKSYSAVTSGWLIGDDQFNNWWNGIINEVRLSNIAHTADQIALFHDRPWALYQPVSRPVYFFQAAAGISIPVAMQNMRGGFNPIGIRGGFINAD